MQQPDESNQRGLLARQTSPGLDVTSLAHDADGAEQQQAVVRMRGNPDQPPVIQPSDGNSKALPTSPEEPHADLRPLKAAEASATQTERRGDPERQRYQELFELAPYAYLITDTAGTVREANRAAGVLLGIPASSLVGKPLEGYITSPLRQAFRNLLHDTASRTDTFGWEGRMRRRPGLVFDAALSAPQTRSAAAELDGSDDAVTIRWLLRDVTDRKREVETRQGQTSALIRTLECLAAEPDLNRFLRQLLTSTGEQLRASLVSLWYYDPACSHWTLGLAREARHSAGDAAAQPLTLPSDEWRLWHAVVQGRKPVAVKNVAAEPHFPDGDGAGTGAGSLLLTPLLLGDEVLGMLRIYSHSAEHYDAAAIQFTQALAQQAALAIQLTRLAERERQNVLVRERERMAQEIHDSLLDGFAGISVQLEAAEDVLNVDTEQARHHIVSARELAKRSFREARRSVYGLRPELLESRDLPAEIERVVDEIRFGTGLAIQFQLTGRPRPLPADMEDHLLGIVQEALTNVLKHAEAQNVEVTIGYGAAELELVVRDDGRGIPPVPPPSGRGISAMREQTARMAGRFRLESAPRQGTRIVILVPIS